MMRKRKLISYSFSTYTPNALSTICFSTPPASAQTPSSNQPHRSHDSLSGVSPKTYRENHPPRSGVKGVAEAKRSPKEEQNNYLLLTGFKNGELTTRRRSIDQTVAIAW